MISAASRCSKLANRTEEGYGWGVDMFRMEKDSFGVSSGPGLLTGVMVRLDRLCIDCQNDLKSNR